MSDVAPYGLVAGAQGAGELRVAAVAEWARLGAPGSRLLEEAVVDLRSRGARFVIAEVPGGAAGLIAFLGRHGFAEESRVADFVSDGVDLVFLRRDLT